MGNYTLGNIHFFVREVKTGVKQSLWKSSNYLHMQCMHFHIY